MKYISPRAARQIYDRLGPLYELAERFEGGAKAHALESLALAPGHKVLNVGVGTGQDQAQLQAAVGPGGLACGLDISAVMLNLTQAHTGAPLCQADGRQLPLADASLDRLYSTYVLDLIPDSDLPGLLTECWRVLKTGGRLAYVCLTEGVTVPSRLFVAIWKVAYAVSPTVCGGCYPRRIVDRVLEAGFQDVTRDVIVQFGVPSEVVVAKR